MEDHVMMIEDLEVVLEMMIEDLEVVQEMMIEDP